MPASNALLIFDFAGFLKYECGDTEDTITAHKRTLAHLAAWLDPMWLPDATRIMLQLYLTNSLNQGASVKILTRRLSHLRHFYGFLDKENAITTDPTQNLSMTRHCLRPKRKDVKPP